MNKEQLEEGSDFTPRFDDKGLIPCIATHAQTGEVIMFAWMNEESLNKSIETGEAYYWSRSRSEFWHKGATSGNIQKIIEMRTDCDQDCIWITVESGPACHTNRSTCFYRRAKDSNTLEFVKEHQ